MTTVEHNYQLHHTVSLLLYKEARYLDDQNYDAWLDLLADDVEYWIPMSRDQVDPYLQVPLTHEDKTLLTFRVNRLSHPVAHSVDRMPRSTHVVSNILIDEEHSTEECLVVSSNFVTTGYQEDPTNSQTIYSGTQIHRLSMVNNEYKISMKKIVLNDVDAPHGNIQIIL